MSLLRIGTIAFALAIGCAGFAGCGAGDPSAGGSDVASPADASPVDRAAPDSAATADDAGSAADAHTLADGAACIPQTPPHGVTALDEGGRILNARGIHLTDWDGFLANPSVTLTLRPPSDIPFPATATLAADHARLYFDLPSTVGANGPTKSVQFDSASSAVAVRIGIFPDRDGIDDRHTMTITLAGADPRPETIPIVVHDEDTDAALKTPILVDFTEDQTGFFASATNRAVVQQAADDWAYFFDDPPFDSVPAGDESKFIWHSDGFVSGQTIQNASAYTGFLLYAYGIQSSALRSGGEGSSEGKPQTTSGATLPLRRSGGLEVETQGNYNTLGWSTDLDADGWWKSGNLGSQVNDLYSIVHHEMGHAHGFNGAYPTFASDKSAGSIASAALADYVGGAVPIDAFDHFSTTVDPASGFGGFGNEYNGVMPRKRWVITRVDLMALEAIGYKMRAISFATWQDTVPDCP